MRGRTPEEDREMRSLTPEEEMEINDNRLANTVFKAALWMVSTKVAIELLQWRDFFGTEDPTSIVLPWVMVAFLYLIYQSKMIPSLYSRLQEDPKSFKSIREKLESLRGGKYSREEKQEYIKEVLKYIEKLGKVRGKDINLILIFQELFSLLEYSALVAAKRLYPELQSSINPLLEGVLVTALISLAIYSIHSLEAMKLIEEMTNNLSKFAAVLRQQYARKEIEEARLESMSDISGTEEEEWLGFKPDILGTEEKALSEFKPDISGTEFVVDALNCPSCGAPLSGPSTGECSFCRTALNIRRAVN